MVNGEWLETGESDEERRNLKRLPFLQLETSPRRVRAQIYNTHTVQATTCIHTQPEEEQDQTASK